MAIDFIFHIFAIFQTQQKQIIFNVKNEKKLDVKLNRFHEMDLIDYIESENGPKLMKLGGH
jgi:hypothetical protein